MTQRAIRKWNTTGRRESQKPQTVASEIRPRSYSPDSAYGSEEPSRRHQRRAGPTEAVMHDFTQETKTTAIKHNDGTTPPEAQRQPAKTEPRGNPTEKRPIEASEIQKKQRASSKRLPSTKSERVHPNSEQSDNIPHRPEGEATSKSLQEHRSAAQKASPMDSTRSGQEHIYE